MGHRQRNVREHWHDRSATLPDGDRLRYLVIANPRDTPWIACFRSDRRGGIHEREGRRLLTELEHPDAALEVMGDRPSRPLTH